MDTRVNEKFHQNQTLINYHMQTWKLEIIMKIVGTVYDPGNQAGIKLE